MKSKRPKGTLVPAPAPLPEPEISEIIADNKHPDFVEGIFSEDSDEGLDSLSAAFAEAGGKELPIPVDLPTIPKPLIPRPVIPKPIDRIPYPIRFCTVVSGRYKLNFPLRGLLSGMLRVDVDRYYPQSRISLEITRRFPYHTEHVIATVKSDKCLGINQRRIHAVIDYRNGGTSLIPADELIFEAGRAQKGGFNYSVYQLKLYRAGSLTASYNLSFQSQFFDSVEFEIDTVDNAGNPATSYDTGSHPNRPATLPSEIISLKTVYQRAGFDVTMSPNTSVIPLSGAGVNKTWSDSEMHNAMITYWSKFANNPQWALWILFAARHDTGRSLGGVMFDDIGPNHRQGTAIFTDSFIQDAPTGDPNVAAWRQRMVFWTAAHEMGHAFNLAHSWQKALSIGGDTGPWVPLTNQREARSFMNYPYNVSGGQASFFSDFQFRFSDDELIFMRHAPRRFVQMGNSNWFVNHGFEAPENITDQDKWKLEIRPNRELNSFAFMEPVALELKLTNTFYQTQSVDHDVVTEGGHINVFIQKKDGRTKQWRSLIARCTEENEVSVEPGKSLYGSHIISTSTEGWLIDEPGFYKIQAGIMIDGEVVMSNVLRIFVAPPASKEEEKVAPEYFTEDVGRAITFDGAPELDKAMDTLKEVTDKLPQNPAAIHAEVAITSPKLRAYKTLKEDANKLVIEAQRPAIASASTNQLDALTKTPAKAAETLGHIKYFDKLENLSASMEDAGKEKEAKQVVQKSISVMKSRKILNTVIQDAEKKLSKMK